MIWINGLRLIEIASGCPVKRGEQDERQELGDEAHGLFVDRCSSLDHRDNQPDHQHDYQWGASYDHDHPKRLAHRGRERAVGLHLLPPDYDADAPARDAATFVAGRATRSAIG